MSWYAPKNKPIFKMNTNAPKKKIIAIIQARMGSTRLHGKMLLNIGNKPMLQHVIERIKKSQLIIRVIVATSCKEQDKPIVALAERLKTECFAGDEEDVLKRFYDAAKKYSADIIVRIPGDEPFIDPMLVDKGIKTHLSSNSDYTSTIINRKLIKGLDFEIFNFEVLEKLNSAAKSPSEREHVTAYIINNPLQFKITACDFDKKYWISAVSLCVDTAEDIKNLNNLYKKLSERNAFFTADNLVEYFSKPSP